MKQYNIYDLFNMVEIEDLATVQESARQKRRDATKKAKIRDRETALLRRNRYEKKKWTVTSTISPTASRSSSRFRTASSGSR